ncbi:MAG: cytidine deaminase [Ideonella sp.]|nr:cytidine deaminase [Ideonella sp.]
MPPPTEADLDRLLQAARAARGHAYAPYSRFAVGAALLDEHGRVHAGCNVENAAYPQSLCAEAVALGVLVAGGGTRVRAAVVVGVAAQPVTPCGGCRQKLREFAADDCLVWSADDRGWRARHTLGALLPAGFGPDHLARDTSGTGAGTPVGTAAGTAAAAPAAPASGTLR